MNPNEWHNFCNTVSVHQSSRMIRLTHILHSNPRFFFDNVEVPEFLWHNLCLSISPTKIMRPNDLLGWSLIFFLVVFSYFERKFEMSASYSLPCKSIWLLENVTLCWKSIRSSAFLWCKMPMFRRAGMREGGKPLPLALQYLIFMV